MRLLDYIVEHIHMDTLSDGNALPLSEKHNLRKTGLLAIAIHNIPEGVAVSIPIYYATGSRKKAFAYSFFAGLTEPLGAGIGYLLLYPVPNPGNALPYACCGRRSHGFYLF